MSMRAKSRTPDCGWCGRNNGRHAPNCQRPHVWYATQLVDLRLNEYQVANLRWLLEQTSGTHNTGDWHGEILHMLEEIVTEDESNGF